LNERVVLTIKLVVISRELNERVVLTIKLAAILHVLNEKVAQTLKGTLRSCTSGFAWETVNGWNFRFKGRSGNFTLRKFSYYKNLYIIEKLFYTKNSGYDHSNK